MILLLKLCWRSWERQRKVGEKMDLRTWKEYYEEQINKAKDAFGNKYVKKLLDIGMLQIKSNLAWHLSRCESPIEQILFTALYFSGLQQELYMVFVDYFVQETIEVGEHKYRADILVKAYNAEKILNIVIECDGTTSTKNTRTSNAG